jgi:hypothetical protein
MIKLARHFTVLCGVLSFFACVIPHPPLPCDAGNPLKRVAVLPMRNDSNDVDGPEVMRKKMVEALENRSYVVKDLKETDQILRDQMGITLGGQLDLTTAQKLGEALGVEGVLYGTLMDFDETTTGVINVKKVRGKFKIVNVTTGQASWSRGLGVRSEMRMQGVGGAVGAALAKASDARDKDVPWVTIQATSTGSDNVGKSFAVGLGTKLFSKAIGRHLDHESTELARMITDNLPWGPCSSDVPAAPYSAPNIVMPEIKMPEPPSFGYADWEGKRDFTAVIYTTSIDKKHAEPITMQMPIAVAHSKLRMDMDMSKMMKGDKEVMKGDKESPLSKMSHINRGDKKIAYTLYPNSLKYIVHAERHEPGEKPTIEKTKIGTEMVGKYNCDKYKIKIINKDGKSEEGLIWNARVLDNMTIKSEMEGKDFKVTMELKDIVLKTPAAALFEIPAGYTEAKGFMDLMSAEPKNKK